MTTAAARPPCPVCDGTDFAALFATTDQNYGVPGDFTILRCVACGVVTYEPRLTDAELARYYPPQYYSFAPPAPAGSALRGRLRELLDDLHLGLRRSLLLRVLFFPALWYKRQFAYARHLVGVPPGRLLDVGCGGGGFLLKAHRLGFTGTGIDIGVRAEGAVAEAGIAIHDATIETFDGTGGPFDVITLNHVFEHLQDPAAALDRIRQLLAPGGRVLVRMPDTDSLAFRWHPQRWFALDTPRHVYLFDRANFARLAGRHGLVVERSGKECIPVYWQHALKRTITGRRFCEPSFWESPLLSLPLLPVAELFMATGWADLMYVWLRRREDGGESSR